MHKLQIIGIDVRLVSEERTGDSMVFRYLTRALLKKRGEFHYRLYTHVTETEALDTLRHELECEGREDVEIVSLPGSHNRFVWNALTLPMELWRRPVSVYHTQYIAPLWLPRSVKLVTHVHDVSFAAHPEWIARSDRFFLNLLIPRSLRRSDRIVVPSQFTQEEIIRYYPVTQGKVMVIPNAVGEEWLEPIEPDLREVVRAKYQLPKRYIIASGTMQPRKNIPFLVEAWAKRPESLHEVGLVLTGNPLGHHVDTRVGAVSTEGIVFTGYVPTAELRALMAEAEVLAFPSLYEGFGIPLLEAFAVGTPVWASDIPPFHEVGGEAFASFDPTSLAEAQEILYSLFVDEAKQERLANLGCERLPAFSWSQSADRLSVLYRKLCFPSTI